ncbi:hypothetical protein [Streptomyces sp. SAS_270]|uniref:hypothetical protein n=1 Tax=Streptomyces sp. SAS_270 TaxID=3412748 RepID=UPI00403C862A
MRCVKTLALALLLLPTAAPASADTREPDPEVLMRKTCTEKHGGTPPMCIVIQGLAPSGVSDVLAWIEQGSPKVWVSVTAKSPGSKARKTLCEGTSHEVPIYSDPELPLPRDKATQMLECSRRSLKSLAAGADVRAVFKTRKGGSRIGVVNRVVEGSF